MFELAHAGRSALQRLTRRPVPTLAVACVLALGVGVLTAVIHLRRAVLRPLPYPASAELVHVLVENEREPGRAVAVAPADFLAWRSASVSLSALGAYVPFGTADVLLDGQPERLDRASISDGLTTALAMQPLAGRWFDPVEYRDPAAHALLLSERLWRARFATSPAIVGSTLRMNGEPYTVVGVLPRAWRIPGADPDIVTPLVFTVADAANRKAAYLGAIGRLRPGTTPASAAAELGAILRRVDETLGDTASPKRADVRGLHDAFTGRLRRALAALLAAAIFVALVACANGATLLFGQAIRRQREWAVVRALGGSTRALLRQALAEALVCAALVGGLGLAVTVLFIRLMPDPRGAFLARSVDLALGGRALFDTFGLALVATALAFVARVPSAAHPASVFAAGRAASLDRRSRRAMTLLGGAQAALAAAVLCVALSLVASFARESAAQVGLADDRLLAFDLELPVLGYSTSTETAAFHDRLLAELSRLPGVESCALVRTLAPREPWSFRAGLKGVPDASSPSLGWQVVTPDYFRVLHVALLEGRVLADGDRSGSERVAVLNQSAARRLAALGRGVGDAMRFNGESYRVVGVVADGLESLAASGDAAVVFLALTQDPVPASYLRAVSFVVRSTAPDRVQVSAVRAAVRRLDAELPVDHLEPLRTRLRSGIEFSQVRLDAALGSSFAGLALVFVLASLSTALAVLVQERRREIAVRMALGASPGRVAAGVVLRALAVVGAGGGAGLLTARELAPAISARLSGFATGGAPGIALAAAILGATGLAAALLPALRASRTDPASMLAGE